MNIQQSYSCSRTVVVLLFLASSTEVRSWIPCSKSSECVYDGCEPPQRCLSCGPLSPLGEYGCCDHGCWYEPPCPKGTFSNNSLIKASCRFGGKGRGGGNECSCASCPSGKYFNMTGATACVDCGAGKYSTITGATTASVCVDCGAGKYSIMAGATACVDFRAAFGGGATKNPSSCLALQIVLSLVCMVLAMGRKLDRK